MSVIKEYNRATQIIHDLYLCTDKGEVEAVFDDAKITHKQERIGFLNECMQVEDSFCSSKPSLEDDYIFHLEIFVEGSWRLLANAL